MRLGTAGGNYVIKAREGDAHPSPFRRKCKYHNGLAPFAAGDPACPPVGHLLHYPMRGEKTNIWCSSIGYGDSTQNRVGLQRFRPAEAAPLSQPWALTSKGKKKGSG